MPNGDDESAETPEFTPVYGSGVVGAVHYNPATRECRVRFLSGATYVYDGVSPQEYEALLYAPSKGRFVNGVLRRAHAYRREL